MEYIVNKPLRDFEFWGGAKDRVQQLTPEELDMLDSELESLWEGAPSDTQINDLFWFDFERAADLISLQVDEDDNIIREEEE